MLIAIGGYEKSGKDSAADILVERHGFVKTYMSEPLERALLAFNPWISVTADEWEAVLRAANTRAHIPRDGGATGYFVRYADIHAAVGYTESKRIAGVVEALQRLGTEVGRDIIGVDTWTNLAQRFIEMHTDERAAVRSDVVITGIRYLNELQMVRRLGASCWWVDRPGVGPVNDHSSTRSVTEEDFDLILTNYGTLDDLADSVSLLLPLVS